LLVFRKERGFKKSPGWDRNECLSGRLEVENRKQTGTPWRRGPKFIPDEKTNLLERGKIEIGKLGQHQ